MRPRYENFFSDGKRAWSTGVLINHVKDTLQAFHAS
jgi:hypothetical protein